MLDGILHNRITWHLINNTCYLDFVQEIHTDTAPIKSNLRNRIQYTKSLTLVYKAFDTQKKSIHTRVKSTLDALIENLRRSLNLGLRI